MGDSISKSCLIDCCHRVTSANDGDCLTRSGSFSNPDCPFSKTRKFEHSHWSIPHNGSSLCEYFTEGSHSRWTNIQNSPPIRDWSHGHNLLISLGIKSVTNHHINWQPQMG